MYEIGVGDNSFWKMDDAIVQVIENKDRQISTALLQI